MTPEELSAAIRAALSATVEAGDLTVDVAARRAEDLLLAVRSTPLPLSDGTLLALSISLGVAHVPERSGDLRSLYHDADAALYDAKRAGRGRVGVSAV